MTVSPPDSWVPNLGGEGSLSQHAPNSVHPWGEGVGRSAGWISGQRGISYLSLSPYRQDPGPQSVEGAVVSPHGADRVPRVFSWVLAYLCQP